MDGNKLLAWRKRHGLTQKELADLLGVRNVTVYRWESGLRAISPYLPLALEALEHRFKKVDMEQELAYMVPGKTQELE